MIEMPPTRNEKFEHILSQSQFATIAELARHTGLHYRNVQSYAILERRPVDKNGVVKYDAAAISSAFDCALEDLFPDEFIDRPYRFRDSYDDGYGTRRKKTPAEDVPERMLTPEQVDIVLGEVAFARMVPADFAHDFVHDLVRRLPEAEYDALSAHLFGSEATPPSALCRKALDKLNSVRSFRKLRHLTGHAVPTDHDKDNTKSIKRDAYLPVLNRFFENGLLPSRIFIDAPNVPAGLGPRSVSSWLADRTKTIPTDHLDYVIRRCHDIEKVEISAELRAQLCTLNERTGVSPERLLRGAQGVPCGLTVDMIRFWLSGRTKSALRSHLDWVRAAWEAYEQFDFITLTQGDIQRIAELLTSIGMGPQAALRACPGNVPRGLTSDVIQSWLSGAVALARRDHFEFTISALQTVVETGRDRLELTGEHVAALEAERRRTGVDVLGLVRSLEGSPDSPPAPAVYGWLSGTIASARRSHYEVVLARWRGLPDMPRPDASTLGTTRYEIRHGRIVLNEEIVQKLRSLKERTGMGGTALVNQAKRSGLDIPMGFKHTTVTAWLNGSVKAAKPEHLEFAIAVWESITAEAPERVPITEDIRETLKRERGRTGIMQADLLRGATDAPDGLSAPMISNWINGTGNTARQDHVEWAMERWAGLPDRGGA